MTERALETEGLSRSACTHNISENRRKKGEQQNYNWNISTLLVSNFWMKILFWGQMKQKGGVTFKNHPARCVTFENHSAWVTFEWRYYFEVRWYKTEASLLKTTRQAASHLKTTRRDPSHLNDTWCVAWHCRPKIFVSTFWVACGCLGVFYILC